MRPQDRRHRVVPLVRAFLPSVRAFALALKEEDGGKDGSWSAYPERYLRRADEFFTPLGGWPGNMAQR